MPGERGPDKHAQPEASLRPRPHRLNRTNAGQIDGRVRSAGISFPNKIERARARACVPSLFFHAAIKLILEGHWLPSVGINDSWQCFHKSAFLPALSCRRLIEPVEAFAVARASKTVSYGGVRE